MLRVNPLVLVAVGAASLLGSFWIRSLTVALVALAAYVVVGALVVPSRRYALACLAVSLVGAVSVVWSTWRLGGHDEVQALTAGLRVVVLAWPGSVAMGYVEPSRLADHLAQDLRLPARFAASIAAAFARLTSFLRVWEQLGRVRRVRGLGPTRSPVSVARWGGAMAFGLLVDALRGATRTSVAMDARGFATAQRRTWAEPAVWTPRDRWGLALAVALGAVAPVASLV